MPDGSDGWSGAPSDPGGRIDYIARLLDRSIADHSLHSEHAKIARNELRKLYNTLSVLRDRDGGRLTAKDRSYLLECLDRLRQHIGWWRIKGS